MGQLTTDQYEHFSRVQAGTPTATDDSTQGFELGNEWLDSNTNTVYKLVDSSVAAAVWIDISFNASSAHPVNVAAVNPTVNDDANAGYSIGDHWINNVTNAVFQITDTTVGAAVWVNLTAGGGTHPVNVVATDPTATDDSNAGYSIGDHWVNTATLQTFQALDVSVGSAVWNRTDNIKVNITITDPTVSNDNTEGYEIGSWWINTSGFIPKLFRSLDVSTGAALWVRSTNIKNNVAAAEPDTTNDETEMYEIGSIWVNTTNPDDHEAYICLDATTGAAVWHSMNVSTAAAGIGKDSPREIFYGNSLIDYGGFAGQSNGEIQYTRVWLTIGTIIEGGSTFVDSGGAASREFRIGLYTQTDPRDFTLDPNTKVRETASTATGGTNGTFVRPMWTVASGGDYTVPETGYYWIGIVADASSLKFATTPDVFRADFLPVRREPGPAGSALPATASGLANPVSALTWAAVVEKE